jgi:hypothetical protein
VLPGKEDMADIQFANSTGSGQFRTAVRDNNGTPSSVLDAGAQFTIEARWSVDAATASALGGQWEVAAYAESIGPGREQQLATGTVAVNGAQDYNTTLTVAGGTLPAPAAGESGVYKVVTVLTHRNFGVLSRIAAIDEGPLVRIA